MKEGSRQDRRGLLWHLGIFTATAILAQLAIRAAANSVDIEPYTDAPEYSLAMAIAYSRDTRQYSYLGYSEKARAAREAMWRGNYSGAHDPLAKKPDPTKVEKCLKKRNEKRRKKCLAKHAPNFLHLIELGTLSLDLGESASAIEQFDRAEAIISDSLGSDGKFARAGKNAFASIIGNGEMEGYLGTGYERILMLNYKTFAYLLQGDRRAFNVTRRSIDWQARERARFEQRLREEEEKAAKKKEKGKKNEEKDRAEDEATQAIAEQYNAFDNVASRVTSAYVNPLGYFVSGMVFEMEASEDSSLFDNARIAYGKALELDPDSEVLRKALDDVENRRLPGAGEKMVHIIVAAGMAPEKVVLEYMFGYGTDAIPIKVAMMRPVPSVAARVRVETTDGVLLGELTPLADMEAIAMRHQKDLVRYQSGKVAAAVVRYLGYGVVSKSIFGDVIGEKINIFRYKMEEPNTLFWSSMPARFHAARLYVPRDLKQIQLVAERINGREIARTTIDLGSTSQSFVYGRASQGGIVGQANQVFWLDQNL